MNDSSRGNDHTKQVLRSDAFATLRYQLKCICLILASYPTAGILGRYLGHYLSRLALVLTGRRGRYARQIDSIYERFSAAVAKREFTFDWFDNNIGTLTAKLETSHFPDSRITVIDVWGGAAELPALARLPSVEARFDRNVAEFKDRITKMRGKSAECLGKMVSAGQSQFDLIYIDGSHYSDDVTIDAVLSWSLLRNQGMMIFDDYIWIDDHYGFRKSACRAINLFLRLIAGEYDIEHVAHQVIIVKTRSVRGDDARATAGSQMTISDHGPTQPL